MRLLQLLGVTPLVSCVKITTDFSVRINEYVFYTRQTQIGKMRHDYNLGKVHFEIYRSQLVLSVYIVQVICFKHSPLVY